MSLLRPAECPASRSAGRWALDALVTVAAAALAVPSLYHDGQHPRPGVLAFIVLTLIAAPLVVRRIWPIPVFGWLLAADFPATLWNQGLVSWPALLISLYTVAVLRSRRAALACACLLELAVVASLLLVARSNWWLDAIFLTSTVVAALALGLYSATRRSYLAELRDRADRLERERDQQAALAVADERARIAREMHDIVAHNLTVMVTLSEAAAAAAPRSPERATDIMRGVAATGRRALADTRRLLGVLRQPPAPSPGDSALEPVPDLAQLDALIEQVRSAGLDTSLEIRGSAPDVPAGVQLTVYRLVQEALTNTLKHGGPGVHAMVRLRYLPEELLVDIDDDGAGATAPAGAGSGLLGMRERVRAYGGDVQAGPSGSTGWRVSARLRLDGGDPA